MIMKLKETKGITIVALIITIVVLMVISVVTIQSISGKSIINHAKNSRDSYKIAQNTETNELESYRDYVKNNNPLKKEMKFYINYNGIINTYTAKEGMTFQQFIESEYNELKYRNSGHTSFNLLELNGYVVVHVINNYGISSNQRL